MAFPDDVVRQAWERAGGQCECRRRTHAHFYTPCGKILIWQKRGQAAAGGWDAYKADVSMGEVLSNCEILCSDCHRGVFGRGPI